MSNFKNQTFDDRDTGNLRYQGSWFLTGSWNASNVGETGTLSSSSDLGANVTFTFPVPAIAFYYYGIPRCCGGLYGICIDCDPNNPQFIPIDAVNTTDDGKNPPVVLYSMTFKQPGVHEIIIRNENDTRFGKSQITMDRIDLQVVDDSAAATSSSGSSFSSPSSTTATSSSTSIAPATTSSTPSTPMPIGAIAGGVVAGVAVTLIGLLLFLWSRRRRRIISVVPATRNSMVPYSDRFPEPYLLSPTTTASHLEMQQNAPRSSGPTMNRIPAAQGYGYASGKRDRVRPSPAPASESAASSSSLSRSTEPRNVPFSLPTPMRELDAGPVNFSEEEEEDAQSTLPPEYTQVFPQVSYRPPLVISSPQVVEGMPSSSGRELEMQSTSGREMEDPSRQTGLSPRRRKF